MYADRYGAKRVDRGSLGLSVAIVGGLVTAAMLSNTVVRTPFHKPDLPIWNVQPVKPPPPDPLPKPQPRHRAAPTPLPEKTLVETPVPPEAPYTPPPQPAANPGTIDGPGVAPAVEPVKPPPPVMTGIEIDPRYASNFQPLYPPAEQRAGRDGVVTLKVLVGVDGRVTQAVQVTATSEEFWRVTLKQALGRWRFRPATRDGVPFESWRTMTVRFRLDEQ